jgi:hypothetical protein
MSTTDVKSQSTTTSESGGCEVIGQTGLYMKFAVDFDVPASFCSTTPLRLVFYWISLLALILGTSVLAQESLRLERRGNPPTFKQERGQPCVFCSAGVWECVQSGTRTYLLPTSHWSVVSASRCAYKRSLINPHRHGWCDRRGRKRSLL